MFWGTSDIFFQYSDKEKLPRLCIFDTSLFLVLIQYFSDMYCEVHLESFVSEFVDIVHICMLLTFTANCIRKWA